LHGRQAESLVACDGFNPSDILERYLAWWREGAFDTGPVSDRTFALLATEMPVQVATAQVHREFGGMTTGCWLEGVDPMTRSLRTRPLVIVSSVHGHEPPRHQVCPHRRSTEDD
jgi:hypothetical protein